MGFSSVTCWVSLGGCWADRVQRASDVLSDVRGVNRYTLALSRGLLHSVADSPCQAILPQSLEDHSQRIQVVADGDETTAANKA
jgi:hypothetical protein